MAGAPLSIRVKGHLLIPFGRPKWDISKITITSVSTDSTYFSSATPCAYINVASNSPLRLSDIEDCLPEFALGDAPFRYDDDEDQAAVKSVNLVRTQLLSMCDYDSDFEKRFLNLYFDWALSTSRPREWELRDTRKDLPKPRDNCWWPIEALLPLPQAHLYLHDPLSPQRLGSPSNMFKVDFAFWTGKRFVAVEVDGKSHIGDEKHVTKDRMLQRAGVQVIHILNKELLAHGTKVIDALMPTSVSMYWQSVDSAPNSYPFIPF